MGFGCTTLNARSAVAPRSSPASGRFSSFATSPTGRSRFCELERSLEGISPRTLSLRLRALEEHGVVERHTYPEVPPRVEYGLTEKGRALVPLIEDMRSYGRRWLVEGKRSGAAKRERQPVSAAA